MLMAAVLAALGLVAGGCSVSRVEDVEAPQTAGPSSSPSAEATAGQLGVYPSFSPDNVFTRRVRDDPIDRRSTAMIAHLRDQIDPHYGGIAALNTREYNPVLYVVDESTPRVDVRFDDCQKKGYTPEGLFDGERQFLDVPVPTDARAARGRDATLTLWSPSTDQLWEFWVMRRDDRGWSACWGGRIDDVSANPGFFPAPYGVSASGLVTVGSMITIPEARARRIEHAMALAVISAARWDRWRYPAQRSDGTDSAPEAIPQGARLRLDPAVDVDSLNLTPLGAAIARAAQTYGFIVVDTAAAVAVMAESGYPAEKATGTDPWAAILGGVPTYRQLENFPWERMQVLSAQEPAEAG